MCVGPSSVFLGECVCPLHNVRVDDRLALRDQGFLPVEPRGLDTGKPLARQNWVTLRL